jgi:hypothetical protein
MIAASAQLRQPEREREQEVHDVSILIFNSLVLDCLKDFSRSDALATAFKHYSRWCRPRIRRVEEGGRKRGFPTDKREVESFLEGMVGYLRTCEQGVLLNLEVPTGPSALEMLKYMHESAQEEAISCSDDEANIMVIPNRIF